MLMVLKRQFVSQLKFLGDDEHVLVDVIYDTRVWYLRLTPSS
jgi:hypothetical protein